MIRIAITQRVEQVAGYCERRDCLDQAWTTLFECLGMDLIPVPNTLQRPADWLSRQGIEGVLLSGGNDLAHLAGAQRSAPERDKTEFEVLNWARINTLPVLGVCRGMQMLNHYLGGDLLPISGHAGCTHSVRKFDSARCSVFDEYQSVNSFHNWGIEPQSLAADCTAEVVAHDGTVEAFSHKVLPWIGIMWHPERASENARLDAQLIRQLYLNQGQI